MEDKDLLKTLGDLCHEFNVGHLDQEDFGEGVTFQVLLWFEGSK